MSNVITIGRVPWSKRDMIERLEEFASLYDQRPITHNIGGMMSPHMFFIWFALQELKPKAIIESGVFLGQGTWLFEQACPNAELYCIDMNLEQIQYQSERAIYFDRDFSTIDWNHLPKEDTVLFFDDHQNAYERLKTAKWFGFKHVIFDDNYPPPVGDCYTLKQAFKHSGFKFTPLHPPSFKARVRQEIERLLGIPRDSYDLIPPNDVDAEYLRENLEVYYEFPPPFKTERTKWNDTWDDEKYPTPEPLLTTLEERYQQIFWDDAIYYVWMCYVKFK